MKLVSMNFAEFQLRHLLLGIALALCFNQVSSTTNETDRLALLAFKAGITGDPFGVLNSWNNSIGFCQWYGVTCSRRHQRVTVLALRSQGLSGSISPHIGNLSFLTEIRLQNNSFDHEIPAQVDQLRRLRVLLLANNSLIGEIPKNISACSNLVSLVLQFNQLTGEIPIEIGSLSKLRFFYLYSNNLTGIVPSSIGNLSSLEVLSLTLNNLGGSIPQVLGHLTNLQVFAFGGNKLSGTIPSSLLNLSLLVQFDAGNNRIQGTLPASIGLKLPDLDFFSVLGNQLEGPIPTSISNWTKLDKLQLGDNRFSGKVPSLENLYELSWLQVYINQLGSGKPGDLSFLCSLTNNTKLQYVGIHGNKFGGVLPKCIGNLSTTLTTFTSSENQISGEIPEEIGNFVNLQLLVMGLNPLSGVIPSNLGNLQNLVTLHLSYSNLGGTIPSSLGNLTKLIALYLGGNDFQGQIPSHLSNCQALNLLDLSNNNLSGVIPPQLIGISSLTIILNLSHNHLTGVLPTEVGNLRALTALDISDNLLVGEIPTSIGDCIALTSLRMGGNFFQGSIPQSIRSLRGIEELDLSRNNLSGLIPEFLVVFHFLKLLNLSYNNFEGMLPREGVFKNATGTSIVGNKELCGGLPEFHLPNCITKSSNRRKINIVILSTSVTFGILGIALIMAFIYLCWLKKKVNEPVSSSTNDLHSNVSYGTLLKATDGFSSTNLIGVGSFGSVYKGILEDNGAAAAVKVLHLVRHGALKSFIAECEALKNIRHRNLLKILSVCSDVEMVAHVGDFGLAKFLLGSSLDTVANQMSSVGLRGTIGYTPPEYAMGCEVSREGDVYSYGILLLEMFTGLSPTDDTFRHNLTLHSFVVKALPERVLEITDNALLHERESQLGPHNPRQQLFDSHDIFQECLAVVYNIGVACSNEEPKRRMSISGVADQLHQIKKKLSALGL